MSRNVLFGNMVPILPSTLSPDESGILNLNTTTTSSTPDNAINIPGIRYSLKIMEEPIQSFEFKTGIDLASIVDSEILDKNSTLIPSSAIPFRPITPKLSHVPPQRRPPSFSSMARSSLPPSYLEKALHSLFNKSSTSIGNKKRPLRPQKYRQHDLPISFLNKRLISRFPLNMYEKFRHKSHTTLSTLSETSSQPPVELPSSTTTSSSIPMSESGPEVEFYYELQEGQPASDEKEISSSDSPENKAKSDNSVNGGSSYSELDQFYNESKRKYDCAFCKSIFKYKGTLKRHLLVKHTSGDGIIDFSKGVKVNKIPSKLSSLSPHQKIN